nr:response regulator [Nanoarchaeota archaeon]
MGERAPKKRILIVEDEPSIIEGYQFFLGDKYELVIKNSGEEGLVEAVKNNINGILVDQFLEGKMSGIDMVKRYNKRVSEKDRVPVIMCTVWPTFEEEARKLGAKDYIVKPIKFNELKKTVEHYFH